MRDMAGMGRDPLQAEVPIDRFLLRFALDIGDMTDHIAPVSIGVVAAFERCFVADHDFQCHFSPPLENGDVLVDDGLEIIREEEMDGSSLSPEPPEVSSLLLPQAR